MPSSSSSIPTQRLPAPSLFVAPPSRNASNLDVSKNDQLSKTTSHTSGLSQSSKSLSHAATVRLTPSAAIPGPSSPLPQQSAQQGSLRPSSPTKTRRQQQQQALSSTSAPGEKEKRQDFLETDFPPPPADPTGTNIPLSPGEPRLNIPPNQQQQQQQQQQQKQPQGRPRRGTAVLDAHWAALQSTLSDIELSASGTSHVFGPNHANALEHLRHAQVELARAWGPRGGADDSLNDEDSQLGRLNSGGGTSSRSGKETTANPGQGNGEALKNTESQHTDASVNTSNKPTTSQSEDKAKGVGNTAGVGARETDADIEAAEQRRKDSDAYFRKVKEGVEEVVNKLETVSRAMRDVEMESREIWGDGTSDASTELDSSSVMT